MFNVKVEYWTENDRGDVCKRTQTIVIAVRSGERIVTEPKAFIVDSDKPNAHASRVQDGKNWKLQQVDVVG